MLSKQSLRNGLITIVLAGILYGCSNQYAATPVTKQNAFARTIKRAQDQDRYFVLHSGVDVYRIKFLEVHKAEKNVTVMLDRIDSLKLAGYRARQAAAPGQDEVLVSPLSQIHLFTRDSTSYTLDEPHTIPFKNLTHLQRVD